MDFNTGSVLKVIVIGIIIAFVFRYIMQFYGVQSSSYSIYMAFYLFLLFSTAILDLGDPKIF